MDRLRRVVLERLMKYYRFLSEWSVRKSVHTVTSSEIAQALDIDATQIRKDFAVIGLMGMGHVGFDVCEVCRAIRLVLGFDQRYEAVLIGAGHLGGALLAYPGFSKYGLHFVAAFDNDQERIGSRIAGCTIQPIKAMKSFVQGRKVRLAVLTTPAAVSQELANALVSAGIKAIWNFTPAPLTVPPDVLVRSEPISVGFSEIAYHLKGGFSALWLLGLSDFVQGTRNGEIFWPRTGLTQARRASEGRLPSLARRACVRFPRGQYN